MRIPLLIFIALLLSCGCSPDFGRQKYTDFGHVHGKRLHAPVDHERNRGVVRMQPVAVTVDDAAVAEATLVAVAPPDTIKPDTLVHKAEDTLSPHNTFGA